ncbi:MAG: protein-export chaperone SecB [Gammaproteobacteria bacterium]|nr:protein-export chaperone SecB [Gammaproteobacteria bacterium]
MSNAETPNPAPLSGSAPQLALQAVYLKDCSFEAPQGPRVTGEWNPQIGLDLNTALNMIEGDLREVVLTVTVSARIGERTMFLVEVKQAGAFVMQNLTGEDLRRAAGAICPAVLFPYARAMVSQLVTQGGFPQLLLPPVNFDALFADSARTADGAGVTKN